MSDTFVATEILRQLGGHHLFIAMTGASSFSSGPDVLTFRLPERSTRNKCKAVRITLDPSDTYTVEFLAQRPYPSCEVYAVSKHEHIYCDKLVDVFEEETGLYLTLKARSA